MKELERSKSKKALKERKKSLEKF